MSDGSEASVVISKCVFLGSDPQNRSKSLLDREIVVETGINRRRRGENGKMQELDVGPVSRL